MASIPELSPFWTSSDHLPGERRRADRVESQLRVLLREDRFATAGYTVNISRSGALLRTSAPLRHGALYDFYLDTGDRLQRAAARVVRELPGYIYAIRFESAALPVTL